MERPLSLRRRRVRAMAASDGGAGGGLGDGQVGHAAALRRLLPGGQQDQRQEHQQRDQQHHHRRGRGVAEVLLLAERVDDEVGRHPGRLARPAVRHRQDDVVGLDDAERQQDGAGQEGELHHRDDDLDIEPPEADAVEPGGGPDLGIDRLQPGDHQRHVEARGLPDRGEDDRVHRGVALGEPVEAGAFEPQSAAASPRAPSSGSGSSARRRR